MGSDNQQNELRRLAASLTRIYLEVERGLRSQDQLRRFMTPQAYIRQQSLLGQGRQAAGPVTADDLGSIHLRVTEGGRVFASILTRQRGGRWGALVLQMRSDPNRRWRVTEMARPSSREVARYSGADQPHGAERVEAAWRRAINDRIVSEQALAQTRERIDEATSPDDEVRLQGEAQRWNRVCRELAHELQDLSDRLRAWDQITIGGAGTPRELDAPIERLLGQPPSGRTQRRNWAAAAALITGYRRRWSIQDDASALGDRAENPVQARDRLLVVNHVRALLEQVRSAEQVADSSASRERDGLGRSCGGY